VLKTKNRCDGCSRHVKDCGRLFRTPIDPMRWSGIRWFCKECRFEASSKIYRRGWLNYVRNAVKNKSKEDAGKAFV